MKKLLLLNVLIFVLSTVQSQDIIVLRDATEIESKVLTISESTVSYKKWGNQDGPTYSISIHKILFIKYANGTKEVFQTMIQEDDNNEGNEPQEDGRERPFIKGARFHAYPSIGFYAGQSMGLDFVWSFGVRIFDYAYIGIMAGVNWVEFDYFNVPIRLDIRGYFPINRYVHPYIELSQGIEVAAAGYNFYYYGGPNLNGSLGYSGKVGVGFDISHFSVGLGYYNLWGTHNGYIKVGVKIGRKS